MRKPIALLTSGTRGDVQPYLALANGLQRVGLAAVLVAPANFAPLVAQATVPFRPLDGNPSELMLDSAVSQALMGGSSWLKTLQASLRFMRDAQPIYQRMLESAWEACQDSAAVLVGLPSLWGMHIAEALRVPCIGAMVQPLTATSAWPSAVLPSRLSLGAAYNRLTHRIVAQAMWLPWRGVIDDWRQHKGLSRLGWYGPPLNEMPIVYGFSERIVPRPSDWPPQHHITGYWRTSHETFQVDDKLAQFVARNSRPLLYFGFGSPGLPDFERHRQDIIDTLHTLDARAVLSVPASEAIDTLTWPEDLFPVREVPHEWLLPQVAAAIHHGGEGTTAAVLHAGVPMLVLPRAVDQYFWAGRASLLGIAPAPIPQRQLNRHQLTKALQTLLTHRSFSDKAKQIRDDLFKENGIVAAVEEIKLCLNLS